METFFDIQLNIKGKANGISTLHANLGTEGLMLVLGQKGVKMLVLGRMLVLGQKGYINFQRVSNCVDGPPTCSALGLTNLFVYCT